MPSGRMKELHGAFGKGEKAETEHIGVIGTLVAT